MTLRYYEPLYIPNFVYLWEAILWGSFGRFPEYDAHDSEEEFQDELGIISFAWQDWMGGPSYKFRGFRWYEAELGGVDCEHVDWDEYLKDIAGGFTRLDMLKREYRNAVRDSVIPDERFRSGYLIEQAEAAIEQLPRIESVHKLFQRHIDTAWARIFQALVSGELIAYGWGDLTQDEIRFRAAGNLSDYHIIGTDGGITHVDGDVYNPFQHQIPTPNIIGPLLPMGAMMEIPQSDWGLTGIAPDARYTSPTGRDYWDVCVRGPRLFELFPRPLLTAKTSTTDSITTINNFVAASDDGSEMSDAQPSVQAPRRRPGAPKKANGEIERACQQLYGKRRSQGEKLTALHHEAMEFAQRVWNVALPWQTFSDYMKPFKAKNEGVPETIPGIMPETTA